MFETEYQIRHLNCVTIAIKTRVNIWFAKYAARASQRIYIYKVRSFLTHCRRKKKRKKKSWTVFNKALCTSNTHTLIYIYIYSTYPIKFSFSMIFSHLPIAIRRIIYEHARLYAVCAAVRHSWLCHYPHSFSSFTRIRALLLLCLYIIYIEELHIGECVPMYIERNILPRPYCWSNIGVADLIIAFSSPGWQEQQQRKAVNNSMVYDFIPARAPPCSLSI